QAQRPALRAGYQQFAVSGSERVESLRQQLRREVDAEDAAARIATSARREHVTGIECEEHFFFQLEGMTVDTQRITAVPCCVDRRHARDDLGCCASRRHPVNLGALCCVRGRTAVGRRSEPADDGCHRAPGRQRASCALLKPHGEYANAAAVCSAPICGELSKRGDERYRRATHASVTQRSRALLTES